MALSHSVSECQSDESARGFLLDFYTVVTIALYTVFLSYMGMGETDGRTDRSVY